MGSKVQSRVNVLKTTKRKGQQREVPNQNLLKGLIKRRKNREDLRYF